MLSAMGINQRTGNIKGLGNKSPEIEIEAKRAENPTSDPGKILPEFMPEASIRENPGP
jgi:hypothetical protein